MPPLLNFLQQVRLVEAQEVSFRISRAFVHARDSEDVKRDPIALVPDVPDLSAPVS